MKVFMNETLSGWHWSLIARNGRVLADGSGFNRRSDAVKSVKKFMRAGIKIVDLTATPSLIGTT